MSDATTLAREHTTEAIGRIVDVMRDWDSEPREVLAAANLLLERGHGKATQAIIAVPSKEGTVAALATMSDTELLATLGEARMRRQRELPAIESHAVPMENEPDPLAL